MASRNDFIAHNAQGKYTVTLIPGDGMSAFCSESIPPLNPIPQVLVLRLASPSRTSTPPPMYGSFSVQTVRHTQSFLIIGSHSVGGGRRHPHPQERQDCHSRRCHCFRQEEHRRVEGWVLSPASLFHFLLTTDSATFRPSCHPQCVFLPSPRGRPTDHQSQLARDTFPST